MATLREDIADISSRLDDAERTAKELPHRQKYLLLVTGFLRRLLDLHLELVDNVERELAPPRSAGRGSATSAMFTAIAACESIPTTPRRHPQRNRGGSSAPTPPFTQRQ